MKLERKKQLNIGNKLASLPKAKEYLTSHTRGDRQVIVSTTNPGELLDFAKENGFTAEITDFGKKSPAGENILYFVNLTKQKK